MAKALSTVASILLLVGVERVAEHWKRMRAEAGPVETRLSARAESGMPNGVSRSNALATLSNP